MAKPIFSSLGTGRTSQPILIVRDCRNRRAVVVSPIQAGHA